MVPDVYWMLIGSSNWSDACRSSSEVGPRLARPRQERVPREVALSGASVEEDHGLERREVRADLGDHGGVVRRLERRRRDEHRRPRLPEHVLDLGRPVRRVDVDEDRADLGGGVLHDRPLGAVRRPDADPVAALDAEREEGPGALVDGGDELGIRVAQPLVTRDEALDVWVRGGDPVEVVADRLAQQRLAGRPGCIAHGSLGRRSSHGSAPVVRHQRAPSSRPAHPRPGARGSGLGDAGGGAALEAGVVLARDVGEGGDLLAAQA